MTDSTRPDAPSLITFAVFTGPGQIELRQAAKPEPADAADALAVALADYHLRLRPLLFGSAVVRIRSGRA